MKPYPNYKPSGVNWLGDIPAHWQVKQNRFVMTCNDDVLPEDTDPLQLLDYIEISDVDEMSGVKGYEAVKFADAPSRARRLVNDGDVIVSTVRTYLRAVASISKPSPETVVSTGFAVLRPQYIEPRFSRYAILYDGFIGEVISRSKGISYPAITSTDLVRIHVPVPTPDEQEAIANYLDAETARIDDLIREKDELIELLKEWRQSVVDEALFHGLNPESASKKSGIAWVKNIPAHWNISRLRFLVKLNPGFSKELDGDMNVSFLPMEAIGADGNLNLENSRKVQEVSSGYTYFEDGDVTIAKITPCFENGKGAVMQDLKHGVGFGTTELIVMRPDSEINSRWLYYLTMSNAFRFPGEAMMLGAGGQKRVPDLFVKDYRAPVPPKSEQKEIADYLDVETAKIDKLITHTTDEIALLKELRAATIADAVLGRIDVRTKQ